MKQLTCLLSNGATQPAVCPLSESVSNRFLIGFCSVSNRFLKQTLRYSTRVATLLLVMLLSVNVWGADPVVLFHETFGDNSGSARDWNDTYSVKSGVAEVYSGVSYTTTNVKQGKNTTGQTKSGLSQSTSNTDAIFEFGPLDVSNYKTLNLSYYWKAASTKGTYTTKISYKTSKSGSYSEITPSATGATTFVQVSKDLPSAVDKCGTLYLKIVFNTSNTQATIDEVELTGVFDGTPPTEPSLSVSPATIDFGTVYKDEEVDAKQVEVTFANLTTNDVTAAISGSAFGIDKKESFTSGDKITITPNTATIDEYEETLTLSATGVDDQKVTITMNVVEAPAFVTYNKVTDVNDLTEGDVIVLASSTTAYGVAPTDNHTYIDAMKFADTKNASLKDNVLKAVDAYELTLAKSGANWTMTGADGLVGTTAAKTMTFGSSDSKNVTTWSISIDGSANASITSTGSGFGTIKYNSSSPRFLNYASGQTAIQIYKKQLAPTNEAVTFAAPEGGSLVIKNDGTPIVSGETTIKNGTVLDVEFGMTPAEAYKDVAIKVTKTSTSEDVTEKVYDATKKQITMPRYAITVAVTFIKLYKIEAATVTGGTLSWEDVNKAKPTYVEVGTLIQALQEEATHYKFKGFDIYKTGYATTKVDDADGLFEMPEYNVTISGTFEEMQCTALTSAPALGTPSISYTDGVTLNWSKLDAASGYLINVWKGSEKILDDEVIEGVDVVSYKIEEEMDVNTEYSYSIAGLGDDVTYCMLGNLANQSTFTTADYPAATLTLSENGVETPVNGKLKTPIDLPTTSTQACDGKVFMGWSENPIDGEVGKDQVSLLDATYTFTDPNTLSATIYAVYAKAVPSGTQKYTLDYTTDVSSKTLGYGSAVDVTASDGSKWVVKASKQQGMQINTGKNASIKIPTCPRNITSIEVTGTAEKAVGLSAEDYSGSGTITYIAFGTDAKEQTIDLTNKSVTSGYIVGKSGANPITKIVVNYEGESTYSNYCTTCQAAVAAPTFGLVEDNYDEPQTLTLSATEGDIYYTINDGEETKYTAAIALNNRGTYEISAYAMVDDRTSETVTKTYTLDWAYTLAELVAEGAPDGRTVTVILTNEVIESIVTSSSYTNGFYTMVGDKKIEVYCKNSPSDWEAGGKVSGTVTCPWKDYQGTWELCPTNWDWASYTAPAKITSLKITGDVTSKNYTAGQKLDFTGLTVTGVYSDNTDQNAHTEDVTDEISWTEVTLTQGQVSATATATLNNAKTGNVAVNASKTIESLTVGAAKTLESIYVADDSEHKKTFFVGRPFSAEGLKVMAHYNMDDDQQIAVANLTITNTTFSEAEAEHAINISYTENDVTKETSYNVEVKYMNLNDLVAEDIATGTSVKVAFSDVEITGFYTNKSEQRTGVYVNVIGKNEQNIELYSSGTPSETLNGWQVGGKIASKGTYISGTWKYYETNDVWEIDFGSSYAWATNIEYTAPSIYPTGIAMSIPSATVRQSKSLDLDAIFTPTNATVLNNLAWESDNAKVTVVPSQDKKSAKVTVAPDATVGTATITVKVDDKDGNELSATCVITIQEYSVPRYGLYNGAISEGNYIFKADGEYYYMNNTNNNGRLANVANENKPEIVNNIITTDAETYVWQIAKSGDYWTIKNLATQTYVISTASGKASLSDSPSDNTEKWTITYDETKEVYTFENLGRSQASSDKDKKYLRNNNNNGWACYGSGTGNAITLYKAGFTPAAALTSIEIQGNLGITEYFQGKSVKYDGLTVEGTYSDASKKTITEGIVWSADPITFTEKGDNISVTITATVQTKNGEIMDDANFTVKVVESQKVSYGLVTSVNTLYDGATIILGAIFGTETAPIYAVNQGFDTKYLAAYRSNTEGSDLEYADEVMKTANASEITLKKAEGGWKLMDENNKYIISNNADIALADKADEATVWTISIEDGVTKIASGNNVICYNTSAPRFKTYTETSQTVINCSIYMKNLLPIRKDLTIGQYTTYCEPYAVVAGSYSGATFWNIADKAYMSDNQRLYSITIEQHLGDLEAGVPYIMLPEAAQLTGVQYGEAVDAPAAEGNNGLVGVFETTMFDTKIRPVTDDADAAARGIYIISDGTLYLCGNNCGVYGNRAYIKSNMITPAAPTGAPRRTIGAPRGTATGLFNNVLRGNDDVMKVIRNNQLYIIKNGRTYNAQGAWLK